MQPALTGPAGEVPGSEGDVEGEELLSELRPSSAPAVGEMQIVPLNEIRPGLNALEVRRRRRRDACSLGKEVSGDVRRRPAQLLTSDTLGSDFRIAGRKEQPVASPRASPDRPNRHSGRRPGHYRIARLVG